MGFRAGRAQMDALFNAWQAEGFTVVAPKLFAGTGRFSETDIVRYDAVTSIDEVVFDRRADYSFKEALTPIRQTLFYFAGESTTEAESPRAGGAVIFLRNCDRCALEALDDMYLKNGEEDFYYKRLREHCRFVVMGCSHSFEDCFCVSMGTNVAPDYDMAIDPAGDDFLLDVKNPGWQGILAGIGAPEQPVTPQTVSDNAVQVALSEAIPDRAALCASEIWQEYDERCIACGRCTLVCPSCTCFTMQDLFYDDAGKIGERRRVQASCMIDGYTDVAGGGSYRQKNGARMRFKALHKVYDHRARFGRNMCVGCGRCTAICPEYIDFAAILNKVDGEVRSQEGGRA